MKYKKIPEKKEGPWHGPFIRASLVHVPPMVPGIASRLLPNCLTLSFFSLPHSKI